MRRFPQCDPAKKEMNRTRRGNQGFSFQLTGWSYQICWSTQKSIYFHEKKRQMILCKNKKHGSIANYLNAPFLCWVRCLVFLQVHMLFNTLLCQSSSLSLHIQLLPFRWGPPDAVSCSGVMPLANVEYAVGCKTRYNQMIEQPIPPKK